MTEEMMRQLITVQREQLLVVTAERDELRRALDRVIRREPVYERRTVTDSAGSTIALGGWSDVTIEFECNNSDLTKHFLRSDHCRDLAIIGKDDDFHMLTLQKGAELLLLSANCSDPDVSLDINYNGRLRARIAGMQLLAGEPLIGGALRFREHLAFIIEATGPRRRFTVYIRTLYKDPFAS